MGKSASLRNRLDRASTAIPLNIAEGNGKFTPLDRCRFFDNARGSALHCAAGLDLLSTKTSSALPAIDGGKHILRSIVSMLVKLTDSNLGGANTPIETNTARQNIREGQGRITIKITIRITT
jgi:four helix bundle protein